MILYHGTNAEIPQIDLTRCRPFKDFGRAFYLSAVKEQAEEVARSRATFFGGSPMIHEYDFDEAVLLRDDLRIKRFDGYTREWADFIFMNRNARSTDAMHDYDIVYGPIANDRVGFQIRRFEDKAIDIDEFVAALQYMKGITYQYAFCTEKAINTLRRL